MSTTLIIISLLLHGVTFLWILTLMQRVQQPDVSKHEIGQMKNQMEDLLISYTAEMKEENERLLRQLEKRKQLDLSQQQAAVPKATIEKQETVTTDYRPIKDQARVKQDERTQDDDRYEEYNPPVADPTAEDVYYEQSDTAKVLTLARQGLSIDQIAKKLNLGKGEVELMLKFHR